MKEASAVGSVVGGRTDQADRTNRRGKPVRQIHKLSTRLLRQWQALDKDAKKDLAFKPIAEQAHKLWLDVQKLAEERELAEAKRKDKGEVLWTIYKPRASWMDRPGYVMRTPHLTITEHGFFTSKEPGYYVHSEYPLTNKPWEDLGKALERSATEFSLEKMRERVDLVMSKPRGYFSEDFGALEREEKARLEKLADCWCSRCNGRGWIGDLVPFMPCACTQRGREVACECTQKREVAA